MSEDREKRVIESTRRSHSDLHAITGNIYKVGRGSKLGNNEKNITNPFKAFLIISGTFGAFWLLAFLYSSLGKLLGD